MIHESVAEIRSQVEGAIRITRDGIEVVDENKVRKDLAPVLARDAAFGPAEVKDFAAWLLWELGQRLDARPASIHEYYMARGRGEVRGFTVPAMNIRMLAWNSMCAALRAAKEHNVGALIFEIARSEMGYTSQTPVEYVSVAIAAALHTGRKGPLFIQGDHFQLNAKKYAANPEGELQAVKDLAKEAVAAGFYNIDVDTSTLVDINLPTLDEQQTVNYSRSAEIAAYIRSLQPAGITISIGGEIGEVGAHNSTEPELRAYMDGFNRELKKYGDLPGLSKISVQSGTTHGGVVLPDGTIADVNIDFDTLKRLSELARKEYGMCGAVQHGASTLPATAFSHFPETETGEIHLATGFMNLLYDNEHMPAVLRGRIYRWLDKNAADERKAGMTDAQFYYKSRKKAVGPFKADSWALPADVLSAFETDLQHQFAFYYEKLKVVNTLADVVRVVPVVESHRPMPAMARAIAEDQGLAD